MEGLLLEYTPPTFLKLLAYNTESNLMNISDHNDIEGKLQNSKKKVKSIGSRYRKLGMKRWRQLKRTVTTAVLKHLAAYWIKN